MQATLGEAEARAIWVEKSLGKVEAKVFMAKAKVANAKARALTTDEALDEAKN